MKRLLGLLLVMGMVGCGGEAPSAGDAASPSPPKSSQVEVDEPPAQAADADPVATLENLGVEIKRNEQGEVIEVDLTNTEITDAGLVHESPAPKILTLPPLRSKAPLPEPQNISKFVADPIPAKTHWPEYRITREIFDEVLTKWHQVSAEQWQYGYSHVAMEDRTGTFKLKDGTTVQWMVKPGGLATLRMGSGTKVYLAKELIR